MKGTSFEETFQTTLRKVLGQHSYVRHNNSNGTDIPDFHINTVNAYVDCKHYTNVEIINVKRRFKGQYQFMEKCGGSGFFLLKESYQNRYRVVPVGGEEPGGMFENLQSAVYYIIGRGADEFLKKFMKANIEDNLQ